ncbi:MAG: GntR family transcriptional regulator [Actinomycetota bacterium]
MIPTLDRTTTGSQVERVLREMILDGRLTPGTHLRETQVAQSLGVSRNTLREALRSLAEHGLVTHHPHRGVVVTDLTVEDVADLFRLRLVLEQAGLAALTETAELERATDAFAAALERGDGVEALEEDFRFHRALVAALGSDRLSAAHERAQGELRLVLFQLDRDYEPPQVEEHRAIVAALAVGKRTVAEAALTAHLERAAERLIVLIRVKES